MSPVFFQTWFFFLVRFVVCNQFHVFKIWTWKCYKLSSLSDFKCVCDLVPFHVEMFHSYIKIIYHLQGLNVFAYSPSFLLIFCVLVGKTADGNWVMARSGQFCTDKWILDSNTRKLIVKNVEVLETRSALSQEIMTGMSHVRKVRGNGCRVSKISYFGLNILKTVLC